MPFSVIFVGEWRGKDEIFESEGWIVDKARGIIGDLRQVFFVGKWMPQAGNIGSRSRKQSYTVEEILDQGTLQLPLAPTFLLISKVNQ